MAQAGGTAVEGLAESLQAPSMSLQLHRTRPLLALVRLQVLALQELLADPLRSVRSCRVLQGQQLHPQHRVGMAALGEGLAVTTRA